MESISKKQPQLHPLQRAMKSNWNRLICEKEDLRVTIAKLRRIADAMDDAISMEATA